jgi:uncharacterized protein YyaL (SSP411 family)
MQQKRKANRLINEKSPYLLQHAYNPVNWYPWGNEAFERAKEDGKPIFLSVGYSTCHWCHVMEKESFENASIAAAMNEHFVSIKVDREERPDVDKVYMTALQAMGQGGGWPMSMFLTPELKPFYGGTYFPPESREGRAGFFDILKRIDEVWKTERPKVDEAADRLTGFLHDVAGQRPVGSRPDAGIFEMCFDHLSRTYDTINGGFGGSPKFPRPVVFNFLLRYYLRSANPSALKMTEQTLRAMASGGIFDHLGGGFHRYAVDAEWRVPHFEKMLYDQALLVCTYTDAYQLTRDDFFATVTGDVLEYVMRDLSSPGGGFYSAEDADSPVPEKPEEMGEGAFYLWRKKDVVDLLGKEGSEIFSYAYGMEEAGNAPFDPQHEFTGKNILYRSHDVAHTAKRFEKPEPEIVTLLKEGREKLFAARLTRPRPHLDDKVITSWNGLMISAFARAFQAFGNPKYIKAAEKSARFVLTRLYDPGIQSLRRRFRDGEARFEGALDDYAFLAQGLIDLYESNFEVSYLERAVELMRSTIRLFWDEEQGSFFDTPPTDGSILVRLKEQYDGAEPTGNSIAAMNLLRLSHMTDNPEWRSMADRVFSFFSPIMRKQPVVMPQMIAALDFALDKPKEVIVAGRTDEPASALLIREVRRRYLPNKVVLLAEPGEPQQRLAKLLPFVRSLTMVDGKATAYICQDFACNLPTSDAKIVTQLLE